MEVAAVVRVAAAVECTDAAGALLPTDRDLCGVAAGQKGLGHVAVSTRDRRCARVVRAGAAVAVKVAAAMEVAAAAECTGVADVQLWTERGHCGDALGRRSLSLAAVGTRDRERARTVHKAVFP